MLLQHIAEDPDLVMAARRSIDSMVTVGLAVEVACVSAVGDSAVGDSAVVDRLTVDQ